MDCVQREGHAQVVSLLIDAGVDRDRPKKDTQSPLWISSKHEQRFLQYCIGASSHLAHHLSESELAEVRSEVRRGTDALLQKALLVRGECPEGCDALSETRRPRRWLAYLS